MSAQYKNINNTKIDKSIVYSIVYNKSCDNDKVSLGQDCQVCFLGMGLQPASVVERTIASVYVYMHWMTE